MKKFLLNTSIFVLIVLFPLFLMFFKADGYTDPYYIRFTTPKQESLILGTSRAAQGLQPKIFKDQMDVDIYNYAFTIAHSPYGSTYLKSIEKKIASKGRNNLFIVTVDPWSISSKTLDPNNENNFRENDLCLAKTTYVNRKPNIDYLRNNFSGKYYDILLKRKSNMFLHENGWLEVDISMDSISVKKRFNNKIKTYKNKHLPEFKYSSKRLEYLKKTITFLQQYGKVYLIRLPIHDEIMEIENDFMPDFSTKIENVISLSDGYYDMTPLNAKFKYTDGNHLYKESGKVVTEDIIRWINKN